MHRELHRDDVVLRVRVAVDRGLELLHIAIGQDVVGDLVADAGAQGWHALVGVFLLRIVQHRVAAQVETVDHIEDAEEDRLAPCNGLVADAYVQGAVVVVEDHGREIDHVVRAGPFQQVGMLTAIHPVLEVVRRAAVEGRVAAVNTAADGIARRGSAEIAVVAEIAEGADAGDELQVVGELDAQLAFGAQHMPVEDIVRGIERTRHHVRPGGDQRHVGHGERGPGQRRRRGDRKTESAEQGVARIRWEIGLARHSNVVVRIAALVVGIFPVAGLDRGFRPDETAEAHIHVLKPASACGAAV